MLAFANDSEMTTQYNNYIAYLLDVKKCSDNTLQAYKRDLSKFFSFANTRNAASFGDFDVDDISDYKDYLNSIGLSPSSVSRSLSALRSIYQFLFTNDIVSSNPARDIHNDKTDKTGPHILTSKEVETLLAQPNTGDIKGIRDKAMLELIYATGIKVTELINLNIEDFVSALQVLRVGYDDKERFIPLYKVAVKALTDYIEKSRKIFVINPREHALFVNTSGERMTRQGFWKILKNYAALSKIAGDITPHTLRHSFAAHLLENGADIHDIQEILGHSDISSTQRYAQFLKNKIKTSYIKFHPRA